jgi:hypothetical protein
MKKAALFCLSVFLMAMSAKPPPNIQVSTYESVMDFPAKLSFVIEAKSSAEITTLELEYGIPGMACSADVNIGIPEDFTPGKNVSATYTWNMVYGVSPVLGAKVWWDWHIVDSDGNEIRTEKQTVTWIDSIHDWKVLQSGNIFLHTYGDSEAHIQKTMASAEGARELLINSVGSWPDADINLYMFPSQEDMLNELYGAPGWIGGVNLGRHTYTILLIHHPDPYDEYTQNTVRHELAHTANDSISEGCYGNIPTWLEEGLAQYSEAKGEMDDRTIRILDQYIYLDKLWSLQEISYAYPEIDGDPSLTYAEAFSVTKFIINTYGQEKVRELLQTFGKGYSIDMTLSLVLGMDLNGLEAVWRKSIGADPAPKQTVNPTPTPLTEATVAPPSIPGAISTATSTPIVTPTITPLPTATPQSLVGTLTQPGSLLTLVCCSLLCLSGGGVLWWILIARKKKPSVRKVG